MNKEKYKQQLKEKIMEQITEKEQELQHRKRRLEENILAGVCNKSILAQRKDILTLELELDCLEYELQHNIIVTTCLVVLNSRPYFWKNWQKRRTPRRTVMGTTDRRRVSFQNT